MNDDHIWQDHADYWQKKCIALESSLRALEQILDGSQDQRGALMVVRSALRTSAVTVPPYKAED